MTKEVMFARMAHESGTMELAPAAGAGIGQKIAQVLLADPSFISTMAEVARAGLKATTRRWDPNAKEWIVEPDFRNQQTMFFGLLAHMEGEPIKRIVHQHLDGRGESAEGIESALRDSPALQSAMERALEKARFRERPGRGRKAEKTVDAVEVDFDGQK